MTRGKTEPHPALLAQVETVNADPRQQEIDAERRRSRIRGNMRADLVIPVLESEAVRTMLTKMKRDHVPVHCKGHLAGLNVTIITDHAALIVSRGHKNPGTVDQGLTERQGTQRLTCGTCGRSASRSQYALAVDALRALAWDGAEQGKITPTEAAAVFRVLPPWDRKPGQRPGVHL